MLTPYVEITIDKPRRLLFDNAAVLAAENAADKSIAEILDQWGVRYIRLLLWAGLKHAQRGLTLEDTDGLLKVWYKTRSISELRPYLMQAINQSEIFGPPKEAATETDQGNAIAAEASPTSAGG